MKRTLITAILLSASLNAAQPVPPVKSMSDGFGSSPLVVRTPPKPRVRAYRFGFKDGSVFYGKIYGGDSLAQGVNPKGLVLETLDNKIYIHHYPAKMVYRPVTDYKGNDLGTYELVPEPPQEEIVSEPNPIPVPVCAPARIGFMNFDKKTLNGLYNHYSYKTRTEYDKGYKISGNYNKIIAKSIYNAYNTRTPHNRRNTVAKSQAWKRKIFKEFVGAENVIWGEHYAKRR